MDKLQLDDELSQMFYDAWLLVDWTPEGIITAPTIMWEGRTIDVAPPIDDPWVRFTISPNDASQASLAGSGSKRQYQNEGIINVQSFGPLSRPNGYEIARYVAIMAERVYQGQSSPNGIWFRNCRTKRVGPSGGWYQFNAIIEYQFNELR